MDGQDLKLFKWSHDSFEVTSCCFNDHHLLLLHKKSSHLCASKNKNNVFKNAITLT